MSALIIDGIGFWASGLPDWAAACAYVGSGELPADAPRRPAPDLLAPNERRRAPDTVALALAVAQAACQSANADPRELPSVFTSTQGDLAITDYMCATLASEPRTISPTRFHNSVHNAAAGYWSIGTGCMAPTTALSAYRASFAQGLIEAAAQLAAGETQLLLVAYDAEASGALASVCHSTGLLGAALVLRAAGDGDRHRLTLRLEAGDTPPPTGPLAARYAGNLMAPMLPLLDCLAAGGGDCLLPAGPDQRLRVVVGAQR
jgi:hypothetical protein